MREADLFTHIRLKFSILKRDSLQSVWNQVWCLNVCDPNCIRRPLCTSIRPTFLFFLGALKCVKSMWFPGKLLKMPTMPTNFHPLKCVFFWGGCSNSSKMAKDFLSGHRISQIRAGWIFFFCEQFGTIFLRCYWDIWGRLWSKYLLVSAQWRYSQACFHSRGRGKEWAIAQPLLVRSAEPFHPKLVSSVKRVGREHAGRSLAEEVEGARGFEVKIRMSH